MDDYATDGMRAALDAVSEITGSETVDILGVCLGGALAAMTAAQLAASGEDRIGTLTLINTLLDYTEPGLLGCFLDEGTIVKLERRMARKGYLDGADMAGTFNALRANDLIFSYVASNWLMGKQPPAFDLLAWNADTTRLPAAMHSWYLRACYMENQLANGTMVLGGQRLDLGEVKPDTYVVAAERDHIVPWRSSYRTTGLLGGDVRYVLASGGHIAGIVSPPEPKAWVMSFDENPRGEMARSRDAHGRILVGGLVALDGGPRRSARKATAGWRQTPLGSGRRARRVRVRIGTQRAGPTNPDPSGWSRGSARPGEGGHRGGRARQRAPPT